MQTPVSLISPSDLSHPSMKKPSKQVYIKRVYEDATSSDGLRILVDRLWPRGLRKDRLKLDLWLKDVAPSNELRKWFSHEPSKWEEFQSRYETELKDNSAWNILQNLLTNSNLTLLYSAKDPEHNQALVLQQLLQK